MPKFDPSTATLYDRALDPATARPLIDRRSGGWEIEREEPAGSGWEVESEAPSARRELPAGVKPNETAGAGRGAIVERQGERQAYEAEQRARKGTQRGVQAYSAGGPIDRDQLRFEPSDAIESGPVADAASQQAARSNRDPMLRPEFIDQVRAELDTVPIAQRLPQLQKLAGGTDVRARAARVILSDVQAENRQATDMALQRPVLAKAMQGAKPASGGGKPGLPRPAMPQVGALSQMAAGQTDDEFLLQDSGGRNLARVEQSPQAFIENTTGVDAYMASRRRNATKDIPGWAEGTALEIPADLAQKLGGGMAQAIKMGADTLRLLPDFVIGEHRKDGLAELSSWARATQDAINEGTSRELRNDAQGLSAVIQSPDTNVLHVLGYMAMHPRLLAGMAVESAPSMAQPLVGAKIASGLAEGLALRALSQAPRTAAVAEQIAVLSNRAAGAGAVSGEALQGAGSVYDQVLQDGGSQEQALKAAGITFVGYATIGKLTGGGAAGALATGRRGALHVAGEEALQEGGQSLVESGAQAMASNKVVQISEALKQAASEAVVGGVVGGVAGGRPPAAPRVEEMPTTPFTPEQTAAMAAQAQARREMVAGQGAGDAAATRQERAQRDADARVVPTPQQAGADRLQPHQQAGHPNIELTNQGREDGRRPADVAARADVNRAGVAQPGTLPRGSLAEAARRQLASRETPATAPDAAATPTGDPQPAPTAVAGESSARGQTAAPQPARTEVPAATQPDGARKQQPLATQAGRESSTSAPEPTPAGAAPTFRSRDHAIAAAVEMGQYQRLEPVQDSDGRWRLQDPQQQTAAPAPTAAPPEAAQRGADAAPTDAVPTMAGSPATGQAAPRQADRQTAGHLTRPSQPEAPTTRETDLQQTAAAAATGAAHADPGRQAEPANVPVVSQSMAKAADQTDRKPAELRADLLQQIDAAMATAPDENPPAWKTPTKARLRQAMVDLHLGSLERAEQALRTAHDNRVSEAAGRIGYVDFDVPGDGAFKVLRSASRLAEFRKLVERSAGFKAQRPGAVPEPDGVHRGSATARSAIENMIDEGDGQAAADYAHSKGIDIAQLDLSPSRLAKIAGMTPTPSADADADAAGADAAAAAGQAAHTAPSSPAVRPELAAALDTRPHEMTRATFLAQVDITNAGRGSHPWSATWRGHQLEGSQQAMDHPDLGRTVVTGDRFFTRRRDAVAAAKQAHERAIRRALRQGDEVPAAVLADYPDLVPKREEKPEPPADTLGIDREKLRGVAVSVPVFIESTGETGEITFSDTAEQLDKNDANWRRAVDGRFTANDGIVFRDSLSSHLADGRSPEEARKLAIEDELSFMRELHHDIEQAVREQHPELFLGQQATTDAGTADDGAEDSEPAADKARIDDAGEKIGGARKDRWAERGMNLADLDAMTEAEGAELVTKAAVWKPDFAAMVTAGSHPKAAAMVKLVVDSLAAKPKDNTPAGRRRYVAAMQAVRQAYSDLGQYSDGLHGVESMARQVLQRAAEKLRVDLGVNNPDPATQREARAVLFSVYKGRSDPFSVGYGIEQRAAKLVSDGFPGKAEPWTRRFEIRTVGSAGLTDAGVRSYLQQAAELASDINAEQLRTGIFVVKAKSDGKTLAMAATKADAQAAARTLYAAQLDGKADGKALPERPHLDVLQRDGLPARIDRDVTPDDLLQTFGFRGTEFGNWTAQDERQRMLNLAFDGLSDLAEIMNVPPAALSLNGTLGLAFGARGGGRAAAHYEPGKLVINLTKLQGGGSLAHEFAHALDHYLGELDRPDAYQTTARGASGWRTRRDYTGKPQRRMVQEAGRWVMREERTLGHLRPELAAALNKVMSVLYAKALPQAEAIRAAELRIEQLQARRAEAESADDAALMASFDVALGDAKHKLADAQAGMAQSSVTTDFARQAQKLSGKSADGYWLRPTEMLARAFEAYAFDRLVAMGARSQYLVHGVESERFAGASFKGNPYPAGEERAAINAAFDGLVQTLQTRRTDQGVALFQRRGGDGRFTLANPDKNEISGAAERNALQSLSQNDDLFALPRSSATTVEAIAADIDPQIKVRRTVVNSLETMYRLTMPDASFALLIERKPNPYGQQPFDYTTVDGEEVPITERPGDNPEDVPDSTVSVYIDASRLKPGGAGARVYAIASAFAHNTGGLFIGDPAGLSDEALVRRPEQMLSSALKQGTTDHLAPHPRQTRGDASLGVPPLRWVYGDSLGNIRRLVELNLAIQQNAGVVNPFTFDTTTGQFFDAAGNRVSQADRRLSASVGQSRVRGAGSGTLARGAVLSALLRDEGRAGETGGRRDGLLARIAGLGGNPDAAGLFYSRDGRSPAGSRRVASSEQVDAVQAAADRITKTWQNAPEIRVLASMDEAPQAAREADQRQRDAGATGSPSAFILDGRVYLLATELPTDAAVASAVLHEAAGHLGLRGVFGRELGAVLGELAALREADVREKATAYGLNFSVKAERLEAAEELLAELAQTEPELGLVQRAIAAIRSWLRNNLPVLADLALTDAEIIARFILPARAFVVDGAARRGAAQAEAGPAFARRRKAGDDADDGASMAGFRAWLEATGPDAGTGVRFTDTVKATTETPASQPAPRGQLPETVEVDGQQRPSRNSAGQPLGVDEEAVRDFWRRFAGSVVVDAAGRPQLVYHGIVDGSRRQFKTKEIGPLGAGVYFRENAADARADDGDDQILTGSWTPGAAPSYVVLRNPYVFDQASFTWPQGHRLPGKPASPITELFVQLFVQLLPESKASLALRKARAIPTIVPKLGGTLRDTLHAIGHDGLVVRFADPSKGAPAYVAFSREQGIRAWQEPVQAPVQAPVQTQDKTAAAGAAAGLPAMIEVDGRQRPSSDALGRPIAASREAIINFWRWFGDSQAVDAQGRPMPLLHGTGHDITAFKPSRFGLFGAGIYLTGSAESADFYAIAYNDAGNDQVMQVYAKLRNPYRLVTEPGWLPDWYGAPTNAAFKHAEDYPLGIKLVAEVMPRESAQRIIDRLMREGTINIGDSLTKQLKAMGHDGIVAIEGFGDRGRPLDETAWREWQTEVVVFDAKGIKSATGNRGSFDGGQRDIRFQRVVDPEDQPAREFTLRPFGRAGKAIELLQDRYNRWKHAIDDVRRQGGTITDDNDFYRAEERYWGVVGSQIEDFKGELSSFVRAVAADGLRIEDVALYAYAQHAEERNDWVAMRRPDKPDGGSGMTTAEADEILEAARQAGVEAQLQRHAITLRRWIQGTRDVLLDGGLIDQDEHDAWVGMFQSYVPLRGADDDAVAVAGQPAGVRRARPNGGIRGDEAEHAQGRSSQALQIIEQIAHDRARALIRSGRNNVLRSFARFVLDNPSPSLWEINAVETRRQAAVDEDGYRTVQETEQVIRDGRTITLKDAGEEIHILVKDAKLLEQLQRMGVDERPAWAIGALLSANRWLSRVYTSLSPVFTAMNALRDTQAAAIGMIDEIGFLGAPKLFAALPRAWVESFKAEAGKPSADYAIFKALGGVTHFHNLTTIDQQAKELEAIVADAERMAIDPRKFLPKAMGLIEALNGGIENATRLAAFKVARESGKSAAEAASIAKNITVNFNRKGTQQLANAWVLFFNPAVQGTARIAQAMANPKVLATLGVGMMGMAALALRNAGMGDDDDGVAWWDKIPDEVKERNIVIVLPPGVQAGEAVPKSKTGRYVKIPMPYGYNFFAVVANQVVDAWRHSHDPKRGRDVVKAGAKAFSAFTSSWLPSQDLGRAVTADDAESAGKSAVLLLVPDALDPLARIGINQDSFGRPMRPDSRFSRNLPDSSNYFAAQHGTLFQRGAGALNQATGGSRLREGMVDVAPATMEHLARSYGGGPVSFGLDIINALYLRQTIARPELDAKRLPFAKQFIGTIDAETDRMTGYQRLDSAEKLIDPIKRAMSAGDGEEARALRQEAGPVAGLGDAVHQTRQRLGEIVKRERAAIDSTVLSDDAKYIRLIELAARRRQVLQAFNKAFDRAILATERQEQERIE